MGTQKAAWVEALRTGGSERTEGLHWWQTCEGGLCGERCREWQNAARSHSAQVAAAQSSRRGVDDQPFSCLTNYWKGERRFLPQLKHGVPAPLESWMRAFSP